VSGELQDQRDRLRLIRSDQIGPITYSQLLRRFGSAAAAIDAVPNLAARGGGRVPTLAGVDDVEREIEAVARIGAHYIFLGEPTYPSALAELDTAPPALIISGSTALFEQPMVAMVGARNASASACRFAQDLAFRLTDAGVVIVSGLARGIDTAAHKGALSGGTIGVIASGIDIAYPPENAALQAAIASEGLLIAEQPPGREPLARHFPSRNRIIAGLTIGTIVVEAAPKSGSLITARLANEAGREVMAVPGSPLDPRAQGCNQLIRDGATLIQSADDVLEAIRPLGNIVRSPRVPYRSDDSYAEPDDSARRQLTSLLSHAPVAVDELIRQSGLPAGVVQMVLLELELAGRLERHAGGRVSRG
jgi:DNA processing protein